MNPYPYLDDEGLRRAYLAAADAERFALADALGEEIDRRAGLEPAPPILPAPALADAARAYALLGIAVFPIAPRGKRPAISRRAGGNGFHDATTDLATVDAWWTKWPEANIGSPSGVSGWDVIDLDGIEGLRGWFEVLEDAEDFADVAVLGRARTSRPGGWHYYVEPLGISSTAGVLPKVDVRSRRPDGEGGGYVLLPPSIGANGNAYRWVDPIPALLRRNS